MNLKQRFSVLFSLLFSFVLAGVSLVIFSLFSRFRTEEFQERLSEKAKTTIWLLRYVKEVDYQLLKVIDKNTINDLYNEKTLIFNDKMELIYSSIDDTKLNWSREDLEYLKKHKTFHKKENEYEVYGMYYDSTQDYFALVTAEDRYGQRKLNYLKYLLVGTFLGATALVWMLSFYVSKKSLRPLDEVRKQIQEITDKNLDTRLPESNRTDEINALAHSFNQMLDRIEEGYRRQKEFTGNASHEIRTPITRITAQIENLLRDEQVSPQLKKTLASIAEDAYLLSDIVTSLLILAKLDNQQVFAETETVRLDEIIFKKSALLVSSGFNFKLNFEIENEIDKEVDLEIRGDETLLSIAIGNLLKNACIYSDNKQVKCIVRQTRDGLELHIINSGKTPNREEISKIFEAFRRGENALLQPGSGLGLLIAKRILGHYRHQMEYRIPAENQNEIVVFFQ